MFNVELIDVHIGQAIKERFEEKKITKSELGRMIGIPQQHINRMFERDSIETKRLVAVSRALDFNFFTLFCGFPTNVSAYLSAIAMGDGDATNNLGDAALIAEMEVLKVQLESARKIETDLRDQIQGLKDSVQQLKEHLNDKVEYINLLKKEK